MANNANQKSQPAVEILRGDELTADDNHTMRWYLTLKHQLSIPLRLSPLYISFKYRANLNKEIAQLTENGKIRAAAINKISAAARQLTNGYEIAANHEGLLGSIELNEFRFGKSTTKRFFEDYKNRTDKELRHGIKKPDIDSGEEFLKITNSVMIMNDRRFAEKKEKLLASPAFNQFSSLLIQENIPVSILERNNHWKASCVLSFEHGLMLEEAFVDDLISTKEDTRFYAEATLKSEMVVAILIKNALNLAKFGLITSEDSKALFAEADAMLHFSDGKNDIQNFFTNYGISAVISSATIYQKNLDIPALNELAENHPKFTDFYWKMEGELEFARTGKRKKTTEILEKIKQHKATLHPAKLPEITSEKAGAPDQPVAEFLRGDEISISKDYTLRYYLENSNVPMRLSPLYVSYQQLVASAKDETKKTDILDNRIAKLAKDPSAREAVINRITKAARQSHIANEIAVNYDGLLGSEKLNMLRFGEHVPKSLQDSLIKSNNESLKKGIARPKIADKQALEAQIQNRLLDDEAYTNAKAKLLANKNFAIHIPLLVRENIPISILPISILQTGKSEIPCFLTTRQGLVLTENFVNDFCGEDIAKKDFAIAQLVGELAILVLISNTEVIKGTRTLKKFGLETAEDAIALQNEFQLWNEKESWSKSTKEMHEIYGVSGMIADFLLTHQVEEIAKLYELNQQYPRLTHFCWQVLGTLDKNLLPDLHKNLDAYKQSLEPAVGTIITEPPVAATTVITPLPNKTSEVIITNTEPTIPEPPVIFSMPDVSHLTAATFLRGDEMVARADYKPEWYLNADKTYRTKPNETTVPLRLAAGYAPYSDIISLEKQIQRLNNDKSYRAVTVSTLSKNTRQFEAAFAISRTHKGLLGSDTLNEYRYGKPVSHLFFENFVKHTEHNLKHNKIRPADKIQKALGLWQSSVLDDDGFTQAQQNLLTIEDFREASGFLARENIPISILKTNPHAYNNTPCFLTLGSGLILTETFVNELCGDNELKRARMESYLLGEVTLLILIKNARNLEQFGLSNQSDVAEFFKEGQEFVNYQNLDEVTRSYYDNKGLIAIVEAFNFSHRKSSLSQIVEDSEKYPHLFDVCSKLASEYEFELSGSRIKHDTLMAKIAEYKADMAALLQMEAEAKLKNTGEIATTTEQFPAEPSLEPVINRITPKSDSEKPQTIKPPAAVKKPVEPIITTPTPIDITNWAYKPKLITNHAAEVRLLQAVVPFLNEALDNEPPHNQFKCSLVLSDNTGTNFPIRLTFRNADGKTIECMVSTSTTSLDDAISLKKAIQSHILSHPSFIPLRLHRLDEPERPDNGVDTIMPNRPAEAVELIEYGGCYAANFVFSKTDNEEAQRIVIPLGLRYEIKKTARLSDESYRELRDLAEKEAQTRLTFLHEYVDDLFILDNWETLGEVAQHLKRAVIENTQTSDGKLPLFSQGWRTTESMPLHYVDDLKKQNSNEDILFEFPAKAHQSTFLRTASLRLEEGGKTANPTWRLMLRLGVTGLDPLHPSEPMFYQASLNLHTADETAAQARGGEAIKALMEDFKYFSHYFKNMEWKWDGFNNSELKLQEIGGEIIPRNPDPQNLADFLDDMPNPKQNFHIALVETLKENNRVSVTIQMQRGSKAENDLCIFNDVSGRPISKTFECSLHDVDNIKEKVARMNASIQNFLKDAYGNRTIVDKQTARKTRQKFSTVTIRNLFNNAMFEHMGDIAMDTSANFMNAATKITTNIARDI